MTKSIPVRLSKTASGLALALLTTVSGGMALAQTNPPPPPATQYPTAVPTQYPAAVPPAAPIEAATPASVPVESGAAPLTDHDAVVGLWGIEARKIGDFRRTQDEELECPAGCLISLNSVGVKKWLSPRYGYSVGLAMAVGGGSRREVDGTATLDTFLGAGPSVGASFLMANWKHLSVSLAPQLDVIYFLPSGKGSKSLLVNLRGLVEGELHLGMIGVPQLSIGISTGLVASFLSKTLDEKARPEQNLHATATKWAIGFTGPQKLWDLVTEGSLRYYF